MGQSQRLRYRELRSLFQLLGECTELGADPIAWRQHLVEQLPSLFGAQMGQLVEVKVVAPPFDEPFWLAPLVLLDSGWPTSSDRKPFDAHMETGRPEDGPHITPDLLRRRLKTVHWSGNPNRSAWLRSQFFNEYVKHAHQDDGLFAHQLIAPDRMRWVILNRAFGDRPFTTRELRLIAALNAELARLNGVRLSRFGEPGVLDLSPRSRSVLICLMEGDSEKQVARRLGISPHTVHDHVKALHSRFGVASRGELLARCRAYWPVLERFADANGHNTSE